MGAAKQMSIWSGRCYESAFTFMHDRHLMGESEVTLVHGMPMGQGGTAGHRRYGHAWCEDGDLVYDRTLQDQPFPRAVYYAIGKIRDEDCYRYSYREAARWAVKIGHYGAWEGPEAMPPMRSSGRRRR